MTGWQELHAAELRILLLKFEQRGDEGGAQGISRIVGTVTSTFEGDKVRQNLIDLDPTDPETAAFIAAAGGQHPAGALVPGRMPPTGSGSFAGEGRPAAKLPAAAAGLLPLWVVSGATVAWACRRIG